MALSTSANIKLSEVLTELTLYSDSALSNAFTAASGFSFNTSYGGSYDRLSNFRGYGAFTYKDLTGTLTVPAAFWIDPTLTHLFVLDHFGNQVIQYLLNVPGFIHTATIYGSIGLGSWGATPSGIQINPNGYGMFILFRGSPNRLFSYSFGQIWDVATTTYSSTITVGLATPTNFKWNTNGTRFWILQGSNSVIYEYTVTTPYAFGGLGLAYSNSLTNLTSGIVNGPTGWGFNTAITEFYMVDSAKKIYSFSINTTGTLSSGLSYLGPTAPAIDIPYVNPPNDLIYDVWGDGGGPPNYNAPKWVVGAGSGGGVVPLVGKYYPI